MGSAPAPGIRPVIRLRTACVFCLQWSSPFSRSPSARSLPQEPWTPFLQRLPSPPEPAFYTTTTADVLPRPPKTRLSHPIPVSCVLMDIALPCRTIRHGAMPFRPQTGLLFPRPNRHHHVFCHCVLDAQGQALSSPATLGASPPP